MLSATGKLKEEMEESRGNEKGKGLKLWLLGRFNEMGAMKMLG